MIFTLLSGSMAAGLAIFFLRKHNQQNKMGKWAMLSAGLMTAALLSSCSKANDEAGQIRTPSVDLQKSPVDGVFKSLEEMPRFPGCESESPGNGRLDKCSEQKLLKFIYSNLNYPEQARKKGISGRVIAQFVINENGTVENIKILKDPGAGLGDEVEKVLSLLNNIAGKWSPGKKDGHLAALQYVLPVQFKLE